MRSAYPNLGAELKRHGITQESLADKIGRSAETVSNWMNGKTAPTIEDVRAIRDTCFPRMSIDYLFSTDPIIR